jgi:hypothetical protein
MIISTVEQPEEFVVAKVRRQKFKDADDLMLITVPKNSGLTFGDYVKLIKVE